MSEFGRRSQTRIHELLVRLDDGGISEAEIAELQSVLKDNPETQRDFAEHYLLACAAEEAFSDSVLLESKGISSAKRSPWLWIGISCAAAIALSFLGYFVGGKSLSREEDPIATLVYAEGCEWSKVEGVRREGERLHPGTLHLKRGTALIRFDGGAELVATGEAQLKLDNEAGGELIYGSVVVRAEDGADGFQLITPASRVVDLGTEFAASVGKSGDTEVHVLDGSVEYQKPSGPAILEAGAAVRFDRVGAMARPVRLNAPRFSEIVRRSQPRSRGDLMWAYEGFHYTPGMLPLSESTVGKGWNGPWRRRLPIEIQHAKPDPTPELLEIVHGQMNVTWPIPGGEKGMLKLPAGRAFLVRELSNPIEMNNEHVWYFSLMIRETARQKTARKETPYESLRLTFRSSTDYHGEALSFGHGPNFVPRIQAGPGRLKNSPLILPPEETTLWVGKVVTRNKGPDEIYFRVFGENDILDYAEPPVWHVVARNYELDAEFDRVLITSMGNSPRIIDELRVGPTWRSVAPILQENTK